MSPSPPPDIIIIIMPVQRGWCMLRAKRSGPAALGARRWLGLANNAHTHVAGLHRETEQENAKDAFISAELPPNTGFDSRMWMRSHFG